MKCRRTAACFVDFVAEVFTPLLAGIPLFLPGPGVAADPLRLVPMLSEAKVSRITLTPSLLSSLLRTAAVLPKPILPDLHVSGLIMECTLESLLEWLFLAPFSVCYRIPMALYVPAVKGNS